jgi:putative spermidine/putrescine transport system substrate-binding protein
MVATRAIYYAEFEKLYGIKVVESWPVNLAKLRAMVESGNIEWTISRSAARRSAEKLGLFERSTARSSTRTRCRPDEGAQGHAGARHLLTTLGYRRMPSRTASTRRAGPTSGREEVPGRARARGPSTTSNSR